ARDDDAGHAHTPDDGAAGCIARQGVRSPVPDVHDRPPWRRAADGRRAVRRAAVRPGIRDLPLRHGRRRGPARRDLCHAENARANSQMRGSNLMRIRGSVMIALIATAGLAAGVVAQQDTIATMNDPRVGLKPGLKNTAEIALKNMKVVSFSPKPAQFDSA